MFQKKNDLLSELTQAIDELSNLRTLNQLEKETRRQKQSSIDLEKRVQVQEFRLEQATIRMEKIDEEEKMKCMKTSALLKEFEKASCNGPFFESLLNILTNYQGNSSLKKNIIICEKLHEKIVFFFTVGPS